MHSLLLTLMSIILIGSITVATVNYLPVGGEVSAREEARTETAILEIQESWESYRLDNQTRTWECETHTENGETFEDCERVVDDPGYLPESNWENALFPAHGFRPVTPADGVWSYSNSADTDIYFCITDYFGQFERRGILRAKAMFSDDRFYLADSCGATTNTSFADDHQGSVSITYWMRRD